MYKIHNEPVIEPAAAFDRMNPAEEQGTIRPGTSFSYYTFKRGKEMQDATQVLSHRDFLRIDKNYEFAASVANLRYVSDKNDGIMRTKKGSGFSYTLNGNTIRDDRQLERIKKLAVPPAWTNVWICPYDDGHIQATGYDARGRKQYRYHPRWSALQQETKFHRMYEFGKVLKTLRAKIQRDMDEPEFTERKMIATVVSLMDKTFIRIGSDEYEKLYGSYGLTTLKNKHVDVKGNEVTFSFRGKKGIYHEVTLKSPKFARLIKQCKAIPGKELFQYYDSKGELRKVDSGQVNLYIKESLEQDFTAKDFRTWAGTLCMLRALKSAVPCTCKSDFQKNITSAFEQVSKKLGNTVAVCKKYYVHPELVRMYKEETLGEFLEARADEKEYGLTNEEEVLMKILKVIQKSKVELVAA